MSNLAIKFAMWLFDAKMEDLVELPASLKLDKPKMIALNHLAMVDSVLWMTFGKQDSQVKFDC